MQTHSAYTPGVDRQPQQRLLILGNQITLVGSAVLLVIFGLLRPSENAQLIALGMTFNIGLGALSWVAARAMYLRTAMALSVVCLILVISVGVFGVGYGLKSSGFPLFATLICACTLFFGLRAGAWVSAVAIAFAMVTYALEVSGWVLGPNTDRQGTPLTSLISVSLLLVWMFLITQSFMQRNERIRASLIEQTRALQATVQAQVQAQRESEAFFAALSHAIHTPLTGIQSGLQLIRDERVSDAKRKVYLRALRRSATELNTFVTSLLDFKATRRGLLLPETRACDLCALAGDLAAAFQVMAGQRKLRWEYTLSGHSHAQVFVDAERLNQILVVLLTNAVKYCQPDDTISFSALPLNFDDKTVVWCFSVNDTGPGIEEATLSRIFQPFIQSAQQQTNLISGTGMGLALAHELAVLMGGTLQVSSEPGRGSRFWLVLPLQRAPGDVSASLGGLHA